MLKKIAALTQSVLANFWSNLSGCELTHIVEASDWAIKNVGVSVMRALNTQHLMRSTVSTTPVGLRNQIVHFDSVHTFIKKNSLATPHHSNKIILTWFHVEPGDPRLNLLREAQPCIQRIHTSCQATKSLFIQAGIEEEKIVVIPLGVNLDLFRSVSQEERPRIRKQLSIPENRLVIGSFQKDGVGWGAGMEPKLIKGPDVFVEVIDQLRDLQPVVLLTGPARGYVKLELEQRNIEYLHIYPKNFHDLPRIYHALDLYLITSRVEGGPLSLLEAWASRVPVVATRVGMVPDIATDGETALMADVENVMALESQVRRLVDDQALKERLVSQAQKNVVNYSWDTIARRYFEELYRPLL